MTSDRRSHIRKLTDVQTVWASITGVGSKGPIRIRDISRAGARLEVGHFVVPGERVRIKLQTVMEARVVYVQPSRAGTWIVGCKFDRELSEEELKGLIRGQSSPSLPAVLEETSPCRLTE